MEHFFLTDCFVIGHLCAGRGSVFCGQRCKILVCKVLKLAKSIGRAENGTHDDALKILLSMKKSYGSIESYTAILVKIGQAGAGAQTPRRHEGGGASLQVEAEDYLEKLGEIKK
jgi:hypothetical protein